MISFFAILFILSLTGSIENCYIYIIVLTHSSNIKKCIQGKQKKRIELISGLGYGNSHGIVQNNCKYDAIQVNVDICFPLFSPLQLI